MSKKESQIQKYLSIYSTFYLNCHFFNTFILKTIFLSLLHSVVSNYNRVFKDFISIHTLHQNPITYIYTVLISSVKPTSENSHTNPKFTIFHVPFAPVYALAVLQVPRSSQRDSFDVSASVYGTRGSRPLSDIHRRDIRMKS